MLNVSANELSLSEYRDALTYLEVNCQLMAYSHHTLYSFEVTDKMTKKKEKLLELLDGNMASLHHWLEHGHHSIARVCVAQSMMRQYAEDAELLTQQINRINQLKVQFAGSLEIFTEVTSE